MKFIDNKVVWGIIGAGDVCELKSGPAFSKVANSELYAVMRRHIDKAADYARRHKVSKYSDNADELLNDDNINAIYIATPPAFHEEYTLRALEAGKAVYVEKPVSLNAESCKRMIKASEKFGLPVSVAHYRRELPLFKEIKKQLDNGSIGKPLFATIETFQAPKPGLVANSEENWRVVPELSGGGYFHDLAPHQLDLMYWYFGAPKKMTGYSGKFGKAYTANDFSHLDVLFGKNVYLTGTWSFSVHTSAETEKCKIVGDKGSMRFSFFRKHKLDLTTEKGEERFEFSAPENIQFNMIEQVVRYFGGHGENPCSLADALVSMEMIDTAGSSQ